MAKKKQLFNKQTAGTKYKTKNGNVITLLNPAEKSGKYAAELKSGRNIYTGEYLSDTQLAFRSGFMQHAKDSQKAFKSKHPKYKRKTA